MLSMGLNSYTNREKTIENITDYINNTVIPTMKKVGSPILLEVDRLPIPVDNGATSIYSVQFVICREISFYKIQAHGFDENGKSLFSVISEIIKSSYRGRKNNVYT